MTTIVFYGKPGCATNARQRQVLESAGHDVVTRDLLTEPWTAARLREFFGDLPVAEWFNRAAPAVKLGEIDPQALSADHALALMLADPVLIRRPLLEIGLDRAAGVLRLTGFDPHELQTSLGLEEPDEAPRLQECLRLPEPHRARF